MTTPNDTQQPENENTPEATTQPAVQPLDEPIIPPIALLGIGFVGIIVSIIALAAGAQGVISAGALAIGIISLIAWAVMNPSDAMDLLRGRNVTFGGTAIVVIALVIGASIMIYAVVAAQDWSTDVSNSDLFSLNDNVRELVSQIAADPSTAPVRIVGFYSPGFAANQDQIQILLEDFEASSDGKITYEFVDPNQEPTLVEALGASDGQIVVGLLNPETDAIIPDSAEVVAGANQITITERIITVTATGDFRAYVLDLEDGVPLEDTGGGAGVLATELRERYKWTVEMISPLALIDEETANESGLQIQTEGLAAESDFQLNDPNADGEVLIIPGGGAALPDAVAQAITNYIDEGGNVIIFAAQSFDPDDVPLAVADNISGYLWENFGVRVSDGLVIDLDALSQFAMLSLQLSDFGTHPITSQFTDGTSVLMQIPQRIEQSIAPPENVVLTELVSTSNQTYVREGLDLSQELGEELNPTEDEVFESMTVGLAAENTDTGARVVIFGSVDPLLNQYRQLLNAGVLNILLAQESFFWATDYESAVGALADLPPIGNTQDVPIVVGVGVTTTVNLIVLGLLPFGVLLTGVAVWWVRREGTRV